MSHTGFKLASACTMVIRMLINIIMYPKNYINTCKMWTKLYAGTEHTNNYLGSNNIYHKYDSDFSQAYDTNTINISE